MLYDSHKLKNTFETFTQSSYEGVSGVLKFEGTIPGQCVGITICTHGNETSGLAAAASLLDYLSKNSLLRGTLYLVLNNIEATRAYLGASNEDEKKNTSYIDVNMNRLPKNILELVADNRYEIRRAQELAPIWKQFTVGLDIHSTTALTDPMIIANGGNFEAIKDLIRGFPIDILISNIDQAQIGMPAATLYGNRTKEARIFAIEAGQHEQNESFDRAAHCSLTLLQNLKMLKRVPDNRQRKLREYFINSSIIFHDLFFDLTKDFKTFDEIKVGEVLAQNESGEEIKALFDGHIIMPTIRRGNDKNISEEVAFLSRPVKIREL